MTTPAFYCLLFVAIAYGLILGCGLAWLVAWAGKGE